MVRRLRLFTRARHSALRVCTSVLFIQKRLGLLKQVRTDLFECARASKLAHPNDILVERQKRGTGPRLEIKLANDIATLVYLLKNGITVPRTLLRNGKKSHEYFTSARNKQSTIANDSISSANGISQPSTDCQPNAPDNAPENVHCSQISCMEVVQNNTSTLQSQCDVSHPSAGGQPNAPDNMHCGEHSQISCIQVVQNNTSTLQPQCDTCGVAVDHYDASTSQILLSPCRLMVSLLLLN